MRTAKTRPDLRGGGGSCFIFLVKQISILALFSIPWCLVLVNLD